MNSWQTKQFKDLQAIWYEKLSANGFVDIEHVVGDDQELIQSATYPYRYNPSVIERQNKQVYFEQLSKHVQEQVFSNEIDKLILSKRADGCQIKEIVDALIKVGYRRTRETVRFTIRRYENSWGIRSWTPKQLTANKKKKQNDTTSNTTDTID